MKPCRHLIFRKDGKSLCEIYDTRLGTLLGKDKFGKEYRCMFYNSLTAEIEGCPMNYGNKPLVNVEIKGNIAIRSRTGDNEEGLMPMSTMVFLTYL